MQASKEPRGRPGGSGRPRISAEQTKHGVLAYRDRVSEAGLRTIAARGHQRLGPDGACGVAPDCVCRKHLRSPSTYLVETGGLAYAYRTQ
jgi:hypothetical protein